MVVAFGHITLTFELMIAVIKNTWIAGILGGVYNCIKKLMDKVKDNERAEEMLGTVIELNGYQEYNIE